MWDKICDLFKKKPCCRIEYMDNNGIWHKIYCYNKEYARGYVEALHKFEITDKTFIFDC